MNGIDGITERMVGAPKGSPVTFSIHLRSGFSKSLWCFVHLRGCCLLAL